MVLYANSCTLERLCLSNADVDDDECNSLMEVRRESGVHSASSYFRWTAAPSARFTCCALLTAWLFATTRLGHIIGCLLVYKCGITKHRFSSSPQSSHGCSRNKALVRNVSVKELDVSHNQIGDKETYNFVRPDYTTGGEAVAEMLEVR